MSEENLSDLEEKGIEHLEKIEKELVEIKERTGPGRWASFRNGIWQGAGAIIGSIVAIILLGFLLSALGVIPGLSEVKPYLQNAIDKIPHR